MTCTDREEILAFLKEYLEEIIEMVEFYKVDGDLEVKINGYTLSFKGKEK